MDHDDQPPGHDDFTRFVLETGPRLYRSALMLAGEPQLAEDLLQTTYARLFASWRRVCRAGNPAGYAHTTLTHVFLSHRRVRRSSEVPSDTLPHAVADLTTHDPPVDLRLDLLAALRSLPTTDRAVVVLRYWEDLTVTETAAQLGLTELAVRSRASRALARIRPSFIPVTEDQR